MTNRGLIEFPNPNAIPNCTHLHLNDNLLQNFPASYFSSRGVRHLDVSFNRFSSARGVDAFQFLQSLVIAGNRLENVEPMRGLVRIQFLDVSNNRLSSLDPLATLPHLRELRAGANRIDRIPDLTRCAELVALDLHKNIVENTENIHKLLPPQVQHLDISENCVAKLCHLTTLAALKQLQTLKLAGNPCWVSEWLMMGSSVKCGNWVVTHTCALRVCVALLCRVSEARVL